jgi:hypothetical protein
MNGGSSSVRKLTRRELYRTFGSLLKWVSREEEALLAAGFLELPVQTHDWRVEGHADGNAGVQ